MLLDFQRDCLTFKNIIEKKVISKPYVFYPILWVTSTIVYFVILSSIIEKNLYLKGNSDIIGILIQCLIALIALVISINWVISQTISANISPHYLSYYIKNSDIIPLIIIVIPLTIIELIFYFGFVVNNSVCMPTCWICKLIVSSSSFILLYALGLSILTMALFFIFRTLKAFNVTDILAKLEEDIHKSNGQELSHNLIAYFDTLSNSVKNNNTLVFLNNENFLVNSLPDRIIQNDDNGAEITTIIINTTTKLLESSSIISLNSNYESISLIFLNTYSSIGNRIIQKNQPGLQELILSLKRVGTRSVQCGFFWASNKTADVIGSLVDEYTTAFGQEGTHPIESIDYTSVIQSLGEIGTLASTKQMRGPCRHCVENLSKVVDIALQRKEEELFHNAILAVISITELSLQHSCSIAGVFMQFLNERISNSRNNRIEMISSLYGEEYPSSLRWIVEVLSKIQSELTKMPNEWGYYQLLDVYESLILIVENGHLKEEIQTLLFDFNNKNSGNFSWPEGKYNNIQAWLKFKEGEKKNSVTLKE